MKQHSKKLLSLLLALVMCLSLFPVTALAEMDMPADLPLLEEPAAPQAETLEVAAETMTIAQARAANQGDTVSATGTVTFTDGRNVTIQDDTGGIGIDFKKKDDEVGKTLALKDTVTVTGKLGNYSKLVLIKELTVKTKGDPAAKLPDSAVKTIDEALAGLPTLESQRIKIAGLTLGATDSKGNTPATKDGKTIILYKMPNLDATIYENCVVDVTAILSRFNDTVQLRVADPADVVLVSEPTAVNAPVPAVATGSAVELNQKIAVTCSTPEAKVQFSTTADATKVWADLPVDGLAMPATKGEYTVYLKAVKEGKTDSPMVTLTYPVGMVEEMTIRQARGVAKGTEVLFHGIVIGDDGFALYIQDETAGIAVAAKISSCKGLKIGDEVKVLATITGPNSTSGLLEAEPSANGITITNASAPAPTPIPVTPAMLNTGLYESRLVSLKGLKLSARDASTSAAKSHTIAQNGAECTLRFWLSDTYKKDDIVKVTHGVASTFKGAVQILQQTKTSDVGIATDTLDGSTTGDPIAEFLLWNSPVMSDSDPVPKEWVANGGTLQAGAKLTVGGGAALKKNTNVGYGSTKWSDGVGTKYWQAVLSTEGLSDITVSATHASSGTGPSAFQLQYSIDATNFKNVPGGYVPILPVKAGSSTYYNGVTDKIPLPADANDQAKVTVRWVLDAAGSAKVPETPVAAGGTNQINSIIIAGNEFYGPDAVAPVKATPAAGTVPAGTAITLATSTADATIHYTTDGSEPTTGSTVYTGP
ncbi:MAG: chitobiase/beta-hexosaminidase C-terminal domain-containing protein, partial [Pseudoflavonifractor sp.]